MWRLKATVTAARLGEQRATPGGVFDHGTREEDGPGTWEALISPRIDSGATETPLSANTDETAIPLEFWVEGE